MKMRRIKAILFFITVAGTCSSQTLLKSSIGSFGKTVSTSSFHVSQHIGQLFQKVSGEETGQSGIAHVSIDISQIVEPDIVIYPNPTQKFIRIRGLDSPATVRIHTLTGKEVYSEVFTPNGSITTSHFKTGVYIITVPVGVRIRTYKFVKL